MVPLCLWWETLPSPVTLEAHHLFTSPHRGGTHSLSIGGQRRRLSPEARFKQRWSVSIASRRSEQHKTLPVSAPPPHLLLPVLKVVSWTLRRIYNAWLRVGDVFVLACWFNTAGWFFAAAASPGVEVKPGNQCLREPWIFFAFAAHEVFFHRGRSCTGRQRECAHLRHTSHCARKKKNQPLSLVQTVICFLSSIRLHSTRTSSSASRCTQWLFGLKRNQIFRRFPVGVNDPNLTLDVFLPSRVEASPETCWCLLFHCCASGVLEVMKNGGCLVALRRILRRSYMCEALYRKNENWLDELPLCPGEQTSQRLCCQFAPGFVQCDATSWCEAPILPAEMHNILSQSQWAVEKNLQILFRCCHWSIHISLKTLSFCLWSQPCCSFCLLPLQGHCSQQWGRLHIEFH